MKVEHGKNGSKPAPERRYLTIMFIDLIGFTGISEQLDPEDLLFLQQRYQRLALTIMERYGGFVGQFSGDGISVYFGYPTARGNDAERAVRAALEMIDRLQSSIFTLHDGQAWRLKARIGVHSGLVAVGPELMSSGESSHGVVGEAVNLAARLQLEAPAGGVVVSRETHSVVEGLFDFVTLGERQIKGLSRPVAIFHVTGARPAKTDRTHPHRSAARMVGREAASARLLACWRAVCEQSRSKVVLVVGDAGLGKTRLVNEFCLQPALGSIALLQTYCNEIFASTALYPVGSLLWKRAGLALEDNERSRRQKLGTLLDEFGLASAENESIIASFPGLTGTRGVEPFASTPLLFKRKQFDFILSVFDWVTRSRPTLLCVEDVHWLDPTSSEMLLELAAAQKNAPLLFLLTTRSFPRGPPLPDADEVIQLDQLGANDCLELARSVPGAQNLTDADVLRAVDAAEGVPLFLEQLILSLMVEGTRAPRRDRKAAHLPLILAELMSERMDRQPGGRPIVQAAACIGRSFRPDFLASLLREEAHRIAESLESLVEAEILEPKRYGGEIRYEFRHSLLQQMAHDSMFQQERRALHARMAEVLQQENDVPLPPEVLAHHLTEAGEFHDAVKGWLDAGLNAGKQSAHLEAIDHLRKGLALLDRIPDENLRRELELNLQAALINSITTTHGATSLELSACSERGLQLCSEHGLTPLVFPFIFGQFTFANCRGRVDQAKIFADMFLARAEQGGYESARVMGHRLRGMWLLGQGEATAAKCELELALALYSPERDAAITETFAQNIKVHTQSLLSLALFCLGDVERAISLGRDALMTADSLRHPHSSALALSYVGGVIFGYCEAAEPMLHETRRLIALSERYKLGGFRAHGMVYMGWAQCQRGQLELGIALLEKAIEGFDAATYRLGVSGYLANLADAQRRAGRLAEAKKSSMRAIATMRESGSGWLEPELRRIDALIERELSPDNQANAERMLRKAAERAREMGFPVFERRCLLSLRDSRGASPPDPEIASRLHSLAHLDNLKSLVDSVMEGGAASS